MVSADSSRPQLINARGTFTPLGVSRSSPRIAAAAAAALADFAIVEDLQAAAGVAIARLSGADAESVVHCAAAAITLAVAATMTGDFLARVVALPDTRGMRNRVVLPPPMPSIMAIRFSRLCAWPGRCR
ncbi:hypothetical protein JMJ56_18955 [Belnapia sp. T18]|uniref:Uncharacterized protein n=1 Tax=Belnapia arida TaxID=2804533 RepID=A0ABS1U620_9PROT|nr:hypothetical protein [Belnapia arida]MBL6080103.1 hypothetical protein [Belnapia arida]